MPCGENRKKQEEETETKVWTFQRKKGEPHKAAAPSFAPSIEGNADSDTWSECADRNACNVVNHEAFGQFCIIIIITYRRTS
jgi:hypothetical protein